jgi:hypothetical protein
VVVEDGVGVGVGILQSFPHVVSGVGEELGGVVGDSVGEAPGMTQDATAPAISKPSPNSNALFTAIFTLRDYDDSVYRRPSSRQFAGGPKATNRA